jgi:hypothetical protein
MYVCSFIERSLSSGCPGPDLIEAVSASILSGSPQSPVEDGALSLLLNDLRTMFDFDLAFIKELSRCLRVLDRGILLLCVDLDNVPRFFENITHDLVRNFPLEIFVLCSANNTKHVDTMWEWRSRVHFFLAQKSKDAADAALTMTMTKFHDLFTVARRIDDTMNMAVSNDRIFDQVCFYVCVCVCLCLCLHRMCACVYTYVIIKRRSVTKCVWIFVCL